MKVYVAEEAGFCFGVRRALDILEELHEEKHEIQTYGELIHNRTVVEKLTTQGIHSIDSLSQIEPGKKLVIRTHGIPVDTEESLKREPVDLVDATCPLVKKLHRIAAKVRENDKDVQFIIVGDPSHPEIIAAASYAPGVVIIASEEEAMGLPYNKEMAVMAQTTFDSECFQSIVSILKEKSGNLKVYETICNATIVRQEAVKRLAPFVDFMVVIGGNNSSNTKKLFNIALERNKNTFHLESYDDLNSNRSNLLSRVQHFQSVGITAGASTPPEDIQKIKTFFYNINSNRVKEINHGRSKRNAEH
jgi:(E)-4-hydroxy-3-methyl-but-2-enyl pyrophosphate reductase